MGNRITYELHSAQNFAESTLEKLFLDKQVD